jgi:glycosyltransferase involved in cell wall biosynthesis
MESIACGTPVVTYDSCGSPELVPPECGLTVPEGDLDALTSAIQRALETDFPQCAAIGKELYDKDSTYRAYLDIYETLRKEG